MEALLPALLACLIVEAGGPSALLSHALSRRYRANFFLMAGIALAALANAALGAAAAAMIQPMLGSGARSLFLAIALIFAGAGLILPVKSPDPLEGWKIGAFATTGLGLFILGFGDAAQFLILALAVWGGHPLLVATGGAIGIVLANILGTTGFVAGSGLPMPVIRRGVGALFCVVGFVIALGPLGLS